MQPFAINARSVTMPRLEGAMMQNSRQRWVRIAGITSLAVAFLAVVGNLTLPPPGLPPSNPQWDESGAVATVAASTRYRAGQVHYALLGKGYRALWETPIRVPVLDLSEVAGGLSPLDRG